MTFKDLLLKYEFDVVVPDLLTVDEPVKNNLYAFKEAFDELRRMAPGNAGGKQIVVSEEIETDDDGNETERYLHATNCEGDLWDSSLAKEVVIEADITEIRALALILWHITFYGFSAEEKTIWDDVPHNRYERKAILLEYRQHCNYARIKPKRKPDEHDLLCALPMEDWGIYHKRESHRNRAKRMRDARQERAIKRYKRLGKIEKAIGQILGCTSDVAHEDMNYLFDAKAICEYEFFSRVGVGEDRVAYIRDNLSRYIHCDLSAYTRADILLCATTAYPLSNREIAFLTQFFRKLLPTQDVRFSIGTETINEPQDIWVFMVVSR